MLTALESLLPVLVVIAAGWAVRRFGLIDEAGRTGIDRLAYYVLFPCLIVLTLGLADYGVLSWRALGATLFLSVVTMGALCLMLQPLLRSAIGLEGPAFTSVFQGATRWNTFVALALAGSLFGTEGLTLIAVAIVAMVPVLNLMAVVVLSHYAGGARPPLLVLVREIARNPLIIACVIGLVLSTTGLRPAGPVAATLDILGRAALAIALVAVGMGLDIRALRRPRARHLIGTALRLLVMPLIGFGYATVFQLSGAALGTAIVALAAPTAANAYLLARQLGGDDRLMAEIITLQTICATVTLPMWLTLLVVV
ncbi:AEC family transporter [Microbaculum marinum]|uniref:AEC family transporter n=1 Tax=Microbaculum marinum TaxID=1764581 RepID=A0AAW9RST3_9HYPH